MMMMMMMMVVMTGIAWEMLSLPMFGKIYNQL